MDYGFVPITVLLMFGLQAAGQPSWAGCARDDTRRTAWNCADGQPRLTASSDIPTAVQRI